MMKPAEVYMGLVGPAGRRKESRGPAESETVAIRPPTMDSGDPRKHPPDLQWEQRTPPAGIQLGPPGFWSTLLSAVWIDWVLPGLAVEHTCVTLAPAVGTFSVFPRPRLCNFTCHSFGSERVSEPLSLKSTSQTIIYYPVLSLHRKWAPSKHTETKIPALPVGLFILEEGYLKTHLRI